MSALDEFVKRHDELCDCELMKIDDLKYCSCGQAERVKELAALRAENATVEKMYKLAQDNLADAQTIIAELRKAMDEARHTIFVAEQTIRNLSAGMTGDDREIAHNEYMNLLNWLSAHPQKGGGK